MKTYAKSGKHIKRLLFTLILMLLVTSVLSCGQFKNETPQATTEEGYTALRDPFGPSLYRWSLDRPFGAQGVNRNGAWPSDIYITNNGEAAPVYPIASGRVVAVDYMDTSDRSLGQYIVIEHSGRFLLPASDGVNITVEEELNVPNTIGERPIAFANQVFSPDATKRVRFLEEAEYTLNEGEANTIYSVYKYLTNVTVRSGSNISNLEEPLADLVVAPAIEALGGPRLDLEIRYFGNRDVKSAAYNVVLGPSGDGSFADVTQMLGFGYLEASSVIQANLDLEYYENLGEQGDPNEGVTRPSSSVPVTTDPSSLPSETDEITEPIETEPPEPVAGTDAELSRARRYINEVNNYAWFSNILPVPTFDAPTSIDSVWVAERFMMEAVQAAESNVVSLSALETLAKAKLHPDITLSPSADYSRIPLATWSPAEQSFTIAPSGIEDFTETTDVLVDSLIRIGNRFEAIVYEMRYLPIYYGGTTRNFGIVSVSDRYVGYFDHDEFNVLTGSLGFNSRYPLSSDGTSLDRYRYMLEETADGNLRILSKELVSGSQSYRDSLPAIESIYSRTGQIVNTGGLQLRVRNGPSTGAEELGFVPEHTTVVVIGPPSNGFYVIFDTRASHAPTGFASAQYIELDP